MLAGRRATDNRCSGNWSGSVPARVPRWFAYPPTPRALERRRDFKHDRFHGASCDVRVVVSPPSHDSALPSFSSDGSSCPPSGMGITPSRI